MTEITTLFVTVFAGATGAAIIKLIDNVVQWFLKRKDAKDAKKDKKVADKQAETDKLAHNTQDALMAHEVWANERLTQIRDCVAVLAIEQITLTCKWVIHDKKISLNDRQRIHAMYKKAHTIGVNGDLKDLLQLIDELPLIDPMQDNEITVTERTEVL